MTGQQWWIHRGAVSEEGHDPDCCDHRYFVSELNLRWRFWTPAGRVETITAMESDPGEYWWRIWTDKTGPAWSWRRRRDDRVHALPTAPDHGPRLLFVDLAGANLAGRASMHIVPAFEYQQIPDFNLTLVWARHRGPGLGWAMTDRPDGGDEISTAYTTKAKARTALLAAGRAHAKILGLPLVKENKNG